MHQKIGNVFISSVILDLLPGTKLPNSTYQVSVCATLIRPEDPFFSETQNSTWYTRSSLEIEVGEDVYSILFTINSINSTNYIYKHFMLLKSDLILLNIANKLINNPPTP